MNDILPELVKKSKCYSDVLRGLGLSTNGSGNHRVVKRWIQKLNLSTDHFDYRLVISEKNKSRKLRVYDPHEFLIEKWTGSISPIKRWAKQNLEYKCKICNNNGFHCNLPLALQLDHENGNPMDNRKENLRWLCPNCHTQCKTYGGKGLHLHRKKKSEINPNWNTIPRIHRRKVIRPSKECLEILISKIPMTQIGIQYGVSDNAVRKWVKSYGIPI